MTTTTCNESDPRQRLYELIHLLRESAITTEEFCKQFETTYNIDLDKAQLSKSEVSAFADLFNKVVWYSPFPKERAKIPNYLGEIEIAEAVSNAELMLTSVI